MWLVRRSFLYCLLPCWYFDVDISHYTIRLAPFVALAAYLFDALALRDWSAIPGYTCPLLGSVLWARMRINKSAIFIWTAVLFLISSSSVLLQYLAAELLKLCYNPTAQAALQSTLHLGPDNARLSRRRYLHRGVSTSTTPLQSTPSGLHLAVNQEYPAGGAPCCASQASQVS